MKLYIIFINKIILFYNNKLYNLFVSSSSRDDVYLGAFSYLPRAIIVFTFWKVIKEEEKIKKFVVICDVRDLIDGQDI